MRNKTWAWLLVIIMVLSTVYACSQTAPSTTTASPPTNSSAPAAPAPKPSVTPTSVVPPPSIALPAAKVFQLKFAHNVPPVNYIHAEVIAPWAAELEKRTDGRVKITIFPAETIGKLTEYYDMVLSNGTDAAMIIPSLMQGRFPLCDVLNLPYLIPGSPDDPMAVKIRRMLFDKYFSPIHFKDVKLLWSARFAPNCLSMGTKPIKSVEDIKGAVIGSSAGRNLLTLLKLVGASVQSFNPADMYTAVERKTVDGVLLPLEGSVGWKLQEVVKFTTLINAGAGPFFMAMNKNVWNGIPADIQKTIDDLNLWTDDLTYKAAAKTGQNALATFQKAGVQTIDLSAAEMAKWVAASKPIDDDWVKSVDAQGQPASKMYAEIVQTLTAK